MTYAEWLLNAKQQCTRIDIYGDGTTSADISGDAQCILYHLKDGSTLYECTGCGALSLTVPPGFKSLTLVDTYVPVAAKTIAEEHQNATTLNS